MALAEQPFEEFEETPSQSTTDFRGNILDPGFDLTLRPMRYPLFYEMYKDAIKNTWTVEETEEVHVSIPDEAPLNDNDELVDELPEDWVYPPDPFVEDNEEEETDDEDASVDEEEPPLVD